MIPGIKIKLKSKLMKIFLRGGMGEVNLFRKTLSSEALSLIWAGLFLPKKFLFLI